MWDSFDVVVTQEFAEGIQPPVSKSFSCCFGCESMDQLGQECPKHFLDEDKNKETSNKIKRTDRDDEDKNCEDLAAEVKRPRKLLAEAESRDTSSRRIHWRLFGLEQIFSTRRNWFRWRRRWLEIKMQRDNLPSKSTLSWCGMVSRMREHLCI